MPVSSNIGAEGHTGQRLHPAESKLKSTVALVYVTFKCMGHANYRTEQSTTRNRKNPLDRPQQQLIASSNTEEFVPCTAQSPRTLAGHP